MSDTERFSESVLKELTRDSLSGIVLIHTVKKLSLHPFYLNDFEAGLKETLRTSVMKYDRQLNGILIAYKNCKLLPTSGVIHIARCDINLNVEADYYVFRPEVGKKLRVFVNKMSKDHVGALAHKTFNVSIPKRNAGGHSEFSELPSSWLGNDVQMGQEILAKITYADLHNVIPYIRAEIEHKKDILDVINSEMYLVSEEPKQVIDRRDSLSADEKEKVLKIENFSSFNQAKKKVRSKSNIKKEFKEPDLELTKTHELSVRESSPSPKKSSKKNEHCPISPSKSKHDKNITSNLSTTPKRVTKTKRKSIDSNESPVITKRIKLDPNDSNMNAKKSSKSRSSSMTEKKSNGSNLVNLSPRPGSCSGSPNSLIDEADLLKMQDLLLKTVLKSVTPASKKKNRLTPVGKDVKDPLHDSLVLKSDDENETPKKGKLKRLKGKLTSSTTKSSKTKSVVSANEFSSQMENINKLLERTASETN